jgi:bifunctional DNase/RNase
MKSLGEALGGKLLRVVIHTLDDKTSTYYAKLVLGRDGSEDTIEVDARPSDSIALALRYEAPIFATEAILSQPTVVKDKEKVNKDIEEFKKFLAEVKPSDFERYDRAHPGHEGPPPKRGEEPGPDDEDKKG